jgi:hypothetical protein
MAMPEAAMYKDHCTQPGKDNIWFAWQTRAMEPEPESLPV